MPYNGIETADVTTAPSYGLFNVAEVHDRGASDSNWIAGFSVESTACVGTISAETLCQTSDAGLIDIFDSSGDPYFNVVAFNIIETIKCNNSIGFNAVDYRAVALDKIKTISEYAVEAELWSGTAAQRDTQDEPANRWLTGATDVTPTAGTGVSPEIAVALVEQNFARNNPGIQATIHISPLIASLIETGFFDSKDGVLRTASGSLVTISRGGDGVTGPKSGSGGVLEHWVYATGPVHVEIGSEELITVSPAEIVNSKNNEVTYVAARPAAVYFDGCGWYGALADASL